MKDRIYSLETEYALLHFSQSANRILNKSEIFNLLDEALNDKYKNQSGFSEKSDLVELKEGRFLENGARFYYDTGHAEWAIPECRSVFDALTFDKSGERVLEELIPIAEEKMRKKGIAGKILIIKNNVDLLGNTYGCHENYLLDNKIQLLKDKRRANFLITFLVTRQILCGAGRVGVSEELVSASQSIPYQISQRADFIYCETSDFTTREPDTRAILDTRDEPHADINKYKRLHLILGDSNMSDWSNFLKLGTTGIILQLLEENYIPLDLTLKDPIRALKEISYNPECNIEIPLMRGAAFTPIEIQKKYLQMAKTFTKQKQLSQESHNVIKIWEDVLKKLEENPDLLATKIDWIIKKKLLEQYLSEQKSNWEEVNDWNYIITKTIKIVQRQDTKMISDIRAFIRNNLPIYNAINDYMKIKGLDWKDYFRQLKIYYGIRERDIRYHDINKTNGLYYLLLNAGLVDTLLENEKQIIAGKHNPPIDTRAYLRGMLIKEAVNQNKEILVDWAKIGINKEKKIIELKDPFASSPSALQNLIDSCFSKKRSIISKFIQN